MFVWEQGSAVVECQHGRVERSTRKRKDDMHEARERPAARIVSYATSERVEHGHRDVGVEDISRWCIVRHDKQ